MVGVGRFSRKIAESLCSDYLLTSRRRSGSETLFIGVGSDYFGWPTASSATRFAWASLLAGSRGSVRFAYWRGC
jgi:hypothetical protein